MQTETAVESAPVLSAVAQAAPPVLSSGSTSKSVPYHITVATRAWRTILLLVSADLAILSLCVVIGTVTKSWFAPELNIQQYVNLWPGLFLFVAAYAIAKLYPVVGMSPAEELRRTTIATTIVFAVLATIS